MSGMVIFDDAPWVSRCSVSNSHESNSFFSLYFVHFNLGHDQYGMCPWDKVARHPDWQQHVQAGQRTFLQI